MFVGDVEGEALGEGGGDEGGGVGLVEFDAEHEAAAADLFNLLAAAGWKARMRAVILSPRAAARAERFSCSRVWRTAAAEAAQRGLPPRVQPWVPGLKKAARSGRARIAPTGRPPPRALPIK